MEVRITKTRVAMAALLVLAGVGLASLLSPLVGSAFATVGQTVNISDNSSSAYFAKVDSTGKLAVGDGAGPLTVDGTVVGRTAAPVSPWSTTRDIHNTTVFIAGPSSLPINVTSMSLSTDAPSGGGISVHLLGFHVPSSASSCSFLNESELWRIGDIGDGTNPVSFTFPTPLQYKPPANTKACLAAIAVTPDFTRLNAVGFYGG